MTKLDIILKISSLKDDLLRAEFKMNEAKRNSETMSAMCRFDTADYYHKEARKYAEQRREIRANISELEARI